MVTTPTYITRMVISPAKEVRQSVKTVHQGRCGIQRRKAALCNCDRLLIKIILFIHE